MSNKLKVSFQRVYYIPMWKKLLKSCFVFHHQMCQVIDTDQDVWISQMWQVQIFDDLDLGSFQIFGLVGQGLPVEVLGHGRCDPYSGRVLHPYSGTLKTNKKAALVTLFDK